MINWLIILTIGIPWAGAAVAVLVGNKNARLQNTLAIIFSLATAAASCLMLPQISDRIVISVPAGAFFGQFTFIADGLGVLLSVIASVIGCLAVVFSVDYMKGETQLGRYYALILLFIGAMSGLVLTNSLLLLFFFWEITALCSYALISFENGNPEAVKGGMTALVITQLGGIGLMIGALAVYSAFNSYEITDFLTGAATLPSGMLAMMAYGTLIAAAAKSAQVPFFTWLPRAMEAPTPISALIHAATMVNAGVYLLARFYPAFAAVPGWREAVMIIGMLTAFMAAIMAILANDLKATLAYSTISQLGYMVYGIGAGGVFASTFHLMSHAVFKALLFLAAGAVIHSVGTRDMRKMGGLGKELPFIQAVFIIGALALAGIPLFNGYFSKDLILEAGLHGGPLWIYIFMVVTAGLTALYSYRMVSLVFFGERRSEEHVHQEGAAMRIALAPLALGTLTTYLLVRPFSAMLEHSLPFHEIHILSFGVMVEEVLRGSIVVLPVIALGLLLWSIRGRIAGLTKNLGWLADAGRASFGFETLNEAIVAGTGELAEGLRGGQTGQLNWNLAGLIIGLVVILALLIG